MSYSCRILADSIASRSPRLTTFEITFPRFILAEVNTHRMFSRNSASSRAIPPEKLMERVRNDMFVPETFGSRVKGMGVGEANKEQALCRAFWESAGASSLEYAEDLNNVGVDKSRVNRLLEPFMWHTAIVTATDWDNFFALRDNEGAQPEFQIIAAEMRTQYEHSDPLMLEPDEWHLPLIDLGSEFIEAAETKQWRYFAEISASRCARVSFDKHTDTEPREDTHAREKRLEGNGHVSPLEHPARPFTDSEWDLVRAAQGAIDLVPFRVDKEIREIMHRQLEYVGNLNGWVQLRKLVRGEHNFALQLQAHEQQGADVASGVSRG